MAQFTVYFTPRSEEQILEAYNWGVEFWGELEAQSWLRELYAAVFRRLAKFPLSCPIAPENAETRNVIRQYIFGRYRVLFEIRKEVVLVLRLTGPYNLSAEGAMGSD